MISAEESRKIAAQAKLEADPTYQKTQSIFEQFEKFVVSAAESGDTNYSVRFEKPVYASSIPTIGMSEAEVFDVFCKYVAPKLRELGYVVETHADFRDYEILIRW